VKSQGNENYDGLGTYKGWKMIEWLKRLTNWKPFGKRPAERLKNRWIDGILKDMQVLKVKNWKELIGNRKEWKTL
jgi:hypothetical protein